MTNQSDQQPTATGTPVSRRRVLKASAITGSVVLGSTSAASAQGRWKTEDGRGGAAVVSDTDFEKADESFVITDRSGGENGQNVEFGSFNCQGGTGGSITLVAWYFRYLSDDESVQRTLYTRSNNIDTDATYTWSVEGALECGEDYVVSYKATG